MELSARKIKLAIGTDNFPVKSSQLQSSSHYGQMKSNL